MGHGGKRAGAGRRKGAHNRASARREQLIAQSGLTPLEVMITGMRRLHELAENERKKKGHDKREVAAAYSAAIDAAHKAAPFVHPKLTTINPSDRLDLSKLTREEIDIVEPILRRAVDRAQRGETDTNPPEAHH